MFYLLSLLSMLGYSVQSTLLAHVSRKVDALDMAVYRNVSFVFTLSPLLFFSDLENILAIFRYWPQLLAMGFTSILSMWGGFISYRYLPIGIVGSIRGATTPIFIALLAYFIFAETLSLGEILFIVLAIGATVFLSLQKNHMPHLNERTLMGIGILLLTALPAAISIFMAGWFARQVDPFVAGYFWEVSIALAAVLTLLLRSLLFKKHFKWIGFKSAGSIALAAWPTLIGTGAFTLAVTLGPLALVSAIGLASVVVATLMAHFLFNEKLTLNQWLGILGILLAVAGLRWVG